MIDTFAQIAPRANELPKKWRDGLRFQWNQRRGDGNDLMQSAKAGAWLIDTVDSLDKSRIALDASDTTICTEAEQLAHRAAEMATIFHSLDVLRDAMGRIALGYGITPPVKAPGKSKHVEDGPAVARMTDPLWWRRQLRKVHAKTVEGAAIDLGYVNMKRDCYVSMQSVIRRAQQNSRNALMLETTQATNELGQEYTLAELAAKGPANKAIRRAELMTRIAGFERIARDLGHAGLFATLTCPSFMHKWTVVNEGRAVVENKHYDGTLPNEAQKHLAKTWAQTRAALARKGIAVYGFRIAEPNHDGTPHWHMLIFVEADRLDALKATIKKYALKVAPGERGADQHRVDLKDIDWTKGSAAGYIAKYVAKNIDGFSLKTDLCGGQYLEADSVHTAHRVEAWASTWGIRQFQQVGGPPIGPWRELRRVKDMPTGAPQHMQDAHHAANRLTDLEAGTVKAVAWDRYCKAQGGVHCGRAHRVKVAKRKVEGLGRYGEELGERPFGVQTSIVEKWQPPWMAHMGGVSERVVLWIAESDRHTWTISRVLGSLVSTAQASPVPWTCVNNCTEGDGNGSNSGAKTARTDGQSGDGRGGQVAPRTGAYQSDGGRIRATDFESSFGYQS